MGKIRQTLTNLVFWLTIIVSCYFIEGIGLLSEQPFAGFDNFSYVSILLVSVALIVTYLIFEHKLNRLKADFVLLPILVILFIIFAWTIWDQKDVTISNVTTGFVSKVVYTNNEKFKYTIELLISFVVLYLAVFVYSRQKVRSRQMMWFPTIYIGITLLSCIGTIFTDWNTYIGIFKNGSLADGVSFWYYNENLFGYVLLIGILCCFAVNTKKVKLWSFFAMFIFFVEMVLTTCATTLILSVVAIFIYVFFEIIFGFKKRPYLSMLFMILLLSVFTVGLITVFMLKNNGNQLICKLFDYVDGALSHKDFTTLSGRKIVWHNALDLISDSKKHLWFGRGYGTSTQLFRGYTAAIESGSYVSSCHSAYIEVLFRHGVLGLILYILGLVYFLVAVIQLMAKKHFRFALIYLLCVTAICIQGIMESDMFFTSNVTGLVQTIIFFMPVVRAQKHQFHKKSIKSLDEVKECVFKPNYVSVSYIVSMVIMTLVFGVITVLICPTIYSFEQLPPILLTGLIILVILLLFFPYFVSLLYRGVKKGRFVFRVIYTSIFTFIIPLGMMVICYVVPMLNPAAMIIPTLLMFFAFIFLYMLYIPRKGSLTEWLKLTFHGAFATPKWGILASSIGLIIFVMIQSNITLNPHAMLVCAAINMIIFLYTFVVVPSLDKKNILFEFNESNIQKIKATLKKDLI